MPTQSGLEVNQQANRMLYSMDTSKWWYRADGMRDVFMNMANQGHQQQMSQPMQPSSNKSAGWQQLGGQAMSLGTMALMMGGNGGMGNFGEPGNGLVHNDPGNLLSDGMGSNLDVGDMDAGFDLGMAGAGF